MMAYIVTTTKDSSSSRIFLGRRSTSTITKAVGPVIKSVDPLDQLTKRPDDGLTLT